MRARRFLSTAVRTLILACLASLAHATDKSPSCVTDAEEAAKRFVTYGVSNRAKALELLGWVSLNQYRQRVQQLMDDEYSPGSKALRERRLGADWTFARLQAATDREFAAAFMTAGNLSASVKDVKVLSHTSSRVFGDEVVIGYTVTGGSDIGRRQRVLTVREANTCWMVDMPQEAWLRIDEIANQLKATRPGVPAARLGPSSVSLQVKLASYRELPGMVEARQRGMADPQGRVWLSKEFVLSEADVESATAGSDCSVTTRGLEEPSVQLTFTDEGAEKLRLWSSANMGQLLAVTVDDEPLVVAKVAAVLGKKLSMCLGKARMNEADIMARQLMGWQK